MVEEFNEKNVEISILNKLPELKKSIEELIEIRNKEIVELKKSQEYCKKIVDLSSNLDFEIFAKKMKISIEENIVLATKNYESCKSINNLESKDTLSSNIISILQNTCFSDIEKIKIRSRHLSIAISKFRENNKSKNLALEISIECALLISALNNVLNEAENLCSLFDEKISKIIETFTSNQIETQIDLFDEKNFNKLNCDEQDVESESKLDQIDNLSLKDITKKNFFYALVLIPTFIVFFYTLIFYNPMFISESEFSIQSNSTDKNLSFTPQTLLRGGSNNDLFIATAYINSFDLFNVIDNKLDLKQHYVKGDIISSLSTKPTIREIENYWNEIVDIEVDSESELLKLSVKSYSPKFSLEIQKSILSELESLINKMNEKAHKDAIKLAENEVKVAEEEVEKTAIELKKFRDNNIYITPETEISNVSNLIANLEKQLTETKTELSQKLTYIKNDSIEIKTLKSKINALNTQIDEIRSRLAGNKTNRNQLSNSVNEYEQINLKHEFAKKKLESAMSSLETAKLISLTKTRYLVMIKNPTLPDESLWPKPFLASVITFLLTIFSFGIVSLIISAIREHIGV